MRYSGRRGQSTLEYVILTGFVVAALIAMGVYMKRGFQGKLRESTDQVGGQYSAYHTASDYTTVSSSHQNEVQSKGGKSTTYILGADQNYERKTGSETVQGLASE